jgi:hypothetical protein
MLNSHIMDTPIFEKPRLFSHWKPSLAQVSSDLPVHNRDPATLRVCSAPYSTHELSDTTVLGSASGGPECKCSSRSKSSGITILVFVPCAITERHQPLSWWVLKWCETALAPLSHLSVISLSAPGCSCPSVPDYAFSFMRYISIRTHILHCTLRHPLFNDFELDIHVH